MSKSRIEREIEEILSKYEEEKGRTAPKPPDEGKIIDFRASRPTPPRGPSYKKPAPGGFKTPDLKRLSSGQFMLLAFGVAALAVLVGSLGGALKGLAVVLVILSVVLFLVPIVLYHNGGTSSGGWSPTQEEKRWRGQPIDYSKRTNRGDDPLEGIKRLFRRR